MSSVYPAGIPFSSLETASEEKPIWFNNHGKKEDGKYTRYGQLPNGDSFGVMKTGVWFEPGYYENQAVLVRSDGERKYMTLLGEHYSQRFPDTMTASPSGKCLLWKIGGTLYSWKPREHESAVQLNDRITRKLEITDAVLRENGILEFDCSDGTQWRYCCDANVMLEPFHGEWTAHCSQDNCDGFDYSLQEIMDADPLITGLVLGEDVEYVSPSVFSDCGIHRLELSENLQRIGMEAFAENPVLERVVIPANVMEMESGAFRDCTGLRELEIEGDPARISSWAEDAFLGCPCEAEYLNLRGSASKSDISR